MPRILCHLVHPAHFHFFVPVITKLQQKGYEILITIRNKDVLEKLLIEHNLKYISIKSVNERKGMIADFINLLGRSYNLFEICREFRPIIMISSSPEVALIGKILKIYSLLFFEDDLQYVKAWAYISGPLASTLLCPESCSAYKWEYKTVKYNGYHELTYLHPNYFKLSTEIKSSSKNRKFLLRLAKLTAYHDTHNSGIDNVLAHQIINKLALYGEVFISAERDLPQELDKRKIKIKASDILRFFLDLDLYIGDSQTMAAEAAVLGIPSLRFNDFVGKLGYLEELEHKYGLTYGIKTSEPQKLLDKIDELLSIPNLKEEWQRRRQKMLSEKIDVTAFLVWFIENYPESVTVMKENPDYQYNFR